MNDLELALSEVQEHLEITTSGPRGPQNNNPPAAPAADQPEDKPQRVRFDEAQQRRVDELIRDAMGRAGREAREEAARLRVELEALKASGVQSDPATKDAYTQLAELRAERDALAREKEETTVRNQLLSVSANKFVDADLAVDLLRREVRLIDGKIVPVDSYGNPRLHPETFEPMTLDDLATDLARRKAFLARGEVRSGAGSTEAQRSMLGENTSLLHKLFGKDSIPSEANRVALRDPKLYRTLREQARSKGILR